MKIAILRVRMRTSVRLAVITGVFWSVLMTGVTASPQLNPGLYSRAIDLYRHGEDERALADLAKVPPSELSQERDTLIAALSNKSREDAARAATIVRAAVMLHTARAFAALARDNDGQFRYHLLFAESYVKKLTSSLGRTPFERVWPTMVLAVLHEGRMLLAASEFSRQVRDPGGDSPELLLALGATEEMAWWIHHEDDFDPGVKGDLKEAERHYRQALILSPDSVEARLRLGRVLVLRDEPEGLTVLGQIGESAELPFQYLARLFEGAVFEKRGDMAEAERRYAAAVSKVPPAQSANMALAHLRRVRGDRLEAAQDVRSITTTKDVLDTADPWFWYSRGTAWRGPGYVDQLRKLIAP